jgi:peptidoglycan/LPS O-acetylase OafA/YrhL
MFWQMIYEILVSFLVAILIYLFIERPAANLIFGIKRDDFYGQKRGTTMVLPSELNQLSQ